MKKHSLLLKELTAIAPRRGKGEQKACEVILKHLELASLPYTLQKFNTKIPTFRKAELFADDNAISCVGASFVSGKFNDDTPVLNSFNTTNSRMPAITFNPVSKGVCMQNYKSFPSVSVNREDIVKLVMANSISGEVLVHEEEFESTNILVGSLDSPKNIVFAHYDSIIGSGAIDNACSVDVVFQLISSEKQLLDKNLFVFAGSEEESISRNEGFYGFEVFDRQYKHLIDSANKLIVLDGIGVGTPSFTNNHADWVFGITRFDAICNKVLWMQNDQTLVMQYYHTALDTIDKLEPKYLEEAKELLLNKLLD